MRLSLFVGLLLALIIASIAQSAAAQELTATAQQLEFFEAKIRPVLVQHCYECPLRRFQERQRWIVARYARRNAEGRRLGPRCGRQECWGKAF